MMPTRQIPAPPMRPLPTGFVRQPNGVIQNQSGDVTANNRRVIGYSKGGSASKRADGIAERGKTRGKCL